MLREIWLLALVLVHVRSGDSQLDGDYADIFGPDANRSANHTTMKTSVKAREDVSEEFSGIDVNFMIKSFFDF